MKNPLKRNSDLDAQIGKILAQMAIFSPGDTEYDQALDALERVKELRAKETWLARLNPDTVAVVIGNLVLVGVIRSFEENHAPMSKGFGMFLKSKNSNTI